MLSIWTSPKFCRLVNSLDSSIFQQMTNNKICMTGIMRFVMEKVRNSFGKTRKYCIHMFCFFPAFSLSLSQTTLFRLFETERIRRRQFQIQWKWQKVLHMGRKHCGKRRNCSLRAISPFLTVFSKGLHCRHVKTRACLGRGYQVH